MKPIKKFIHENESLALALAIIYFLMFVSVIVFVYQKRISEQDVLKLQETSFEKLDGWDADNPARALTALQKSCARIIKKSPDANFGVGKFAGTAKDWQNVCEKLSSTNTNPHKFFEENFTPYAIWGGDGRDGLFTGYYEPTLYGSLTKSAEYNIPLYSKPLDLIKIRLDKFLPELKGRTITGRVEGQEFIPYHTRTEIEDGALNNKEHEIVWVNNAVDAFFLHIQGSGRVVLDNGGVLRVGYAGQNGHGYTAIGRELIARKAISREEISMQSIRKWLEENPNEAADVMNINNSYIFFHELDKDLDGPLGAEGISLTPLRSLAVDRKKIPYGVPIWLDAEEPEGGKRIQRLMVAQDTGGAIKGSVRGDFFWGASKEGTHKAGLMKSKGSTWLLLPKSVIVPKEKVMTTW